MAFSSLQVGANAVQAHDKAMGVIGDNIANTNTLAYKGSAAHFGDMLAQSIGTSTATGLNQVGTGSQINAVSPNFSQGSFRGTSQATDMAIDGDGFFKMRVPESNNEAQSLATYYTRAGNFTVDKDGYLTGPEGARVQGWQASKNDQGDFVINGGTEGEGDINIEQLSNTTQATENVSMKLNLNASADPIYPDDLAFDPTDKNSYHFKTESTVYDSQGGEHIVSQYYRKVSENRWEYHTVAKAAEVDRNSGDATVANDSELAESVSEGLYDTNEDGNADLSRLFRGTLRFDGDGALIEENGGVDWDNPDGGDGTVATADSTTTTGGGDPVAVGTFVDGGGPGDVEVRIPWANGSAATNPPDTEDTATFGQITFNHGTDQNTENGNGLDGATQRAGESVLYSQSVDGRGLGSLNSFSVNEEGVIVGTFDNGSTQPLAKVAIAEVDNPEALTREGGNKYTLSDAAGAATIREPGTGGAGTIRGFSLEESNVKASEQFTRMIAIQRGYQANTKTIQTVDEMLQQLMRVK
jgi:flagellar hook protein FlgE